MIESALGLLDEVLLLIFAAGALIGALLMIVLSATVLATMNVMGVTLIAATLVVPAVVARMLTDSFGKMLALSGVVGIAVADTLYFMSLNRLGAGLEAVVSCLYFPLIAVAARLFLHEALPPTTVAGGSLVVAGILERGERHAVAGPPVIDHPAACERVQPGREF